MRSDEADEPYRPREAHGGRREDRDPQDHVPPQLGHVYAETVDLGVAQLERGELPEVRREEGADQEDHQQHDEDVVHVDVPRDAAEHPERDRCGCVASRQHLHRVHQRLEQEQQGHTREHDRGPAGGPPHRDAVYHHARGHGAHEGAHYRGVPAEDLGTPAEPYHQGRTEGRRHRYSQGVRLRQGVVQDGLHLRPGHAQGDTREKREAALRHAVAPHRVPQTGGRRTGVEKRLEGLRRAPSHEERCVHNEEDDGRRYHGQNYGLPAADHPPIYRLPDRGPHRLMLRRDRTRYPRSRRARARPDRRLRRPGPPG